MRSTTATGRVLAVGLMVLFSLALTGPALAARQAFALPAIPRNPRPATLPPSLFMGKVAEAYRIAREAPELIERMPCYCGCYKNVSHQNNLDCYVDKHAAR